jgi:Fe-S cluster assembly protein SufB
MMALPNPALSQVPGGYKYGWHDAEQPLPVFKKGLSAEVVAEISRIKGEPDWMTKLRLKAYRHFESRPLPTWGGDMTGIDFQDIYYYVTGTGKSVQSWDDVPDYIRRTYDRLGIPEAEKKYLAGVGGQYDSEVVYHNIREDLEKQRVIFLGTDQALKEHEEIFREYFGTIIPANDNKLAALNSAVWSGGSFIYVPPGVEVEVPLQAYFRVNSEKLGQFERTLIIADEGAKLHYIEGCTAPTNSSDSFHSGVIEIVVRPGANVRYTTIQNWSNNMYNLVTQRAKVHRDARMAWLDGNLGSKVTM